MVRNRNAHLVDRIYKIFTRARPEDKGFDKNGRLSVSPVYGSQSLNLKVRLDKAKEINKMNHKVLTKLQNVKPKVITAYQCEKNA